jgi:hypothetical protein
MRARKAWVGADLIAMAIVVAGSASVVCAREATRAVDAIGRIERPAQGEPEAPAPHALVHEHTYVGAMKHAPHDVPAGVANVVAHVPEGFDASAPLHLVLYFHGAVQCAALIAGLGPIVCKDGGPAYLGYGFDVRHDAANTRSIYVTPQFAFYGGGDASRFARAEEFHDFVGELVSDDLAPALGDARSADDVESITIIAHSAGWQPLVSVLAQKDGVARKVKNVVLLDGLFAGGREAYVRWLEEDASRRFVYIFGAWGDTNGSGKWIADELRRAGEPRVAYKPKGALADAIRENRVVIYDSGVDHYWMPLLFVDKVIEAIDLPQRAPRDTEAPTDLARASAIHRGDTIDARLDDDDTPLARGAVADDYVLALDEGERAIVTARGGASETETCCKLDVLVQIFHDGKEIARDDDRAGGFDARADIVAPARGDYVVRVTTHGPWRKRGPYTLSIE